MFIFLSYFSVITIYFSQHNAYFSRLCALFSSEVYIYCLLINNFLYEETVKMQFLKLFAQT